MSDDAGIPTSDEIDEHVEERLDEVEDQSFPASDPHSDWAGPAN